jgi:hypothetical protein
MKPQHFVPFLLLVFLSQATAQVNTIVTRLDLAQYKAHIKGLAEFGDRMQGTQRNRDAIDWLEKQLTSFGYTNVQRQRFMSSSGPLENIYATKSGATTPEEMYIVSAHMDGRGGGQAADDDGSGCAVVLELARVLAMPDVRRTARSGSRSGTMKNSEWMEAEPTPSSADGSRVRPRSPSGSASSSTT